MQRQDEVLLSSCLFDQPAVDVLVQDAGEKRLVWQSLLNGCLLEADKIAFSHSDVHALVFPQSCASRLTVPRRLAPKIRDTLSFPVLDGVE